MRIQSGKVQVSTQGTLANLKTVLYGVAVILLSSIPIIFPTAHTLVDFGKMIFAAVFGLACFAIGTRLGVQEEQLVQVPAPANPIEVPK
jgi:hypothetical protein